jgi:UDP-glucose 4-epimerase
MSWRDAYRGRRVLLLGASGFIGRWVAQRLAEAGAVLHLGVRNAASAGALPGVVLEGDLAQPGVAEALIQRIRPAVAFNLTGYGIDPNESDPALARRINRDLVVELATACAKSADPSWRGQQLLHAGSAAEYGSAGGDLAEDTPPTPTTLYGRTKLAGTTALLNAVKTATLRAVTARLFTVYGPGERTGRLLPSLIAAARHGAVIPLTEGSQRRDFTYVEDVAEGLLRLGVESGEGLGAINLATGRLVTVRAFVERAARVLGLAPERLGFGALPTRPDEMEPSAVNVDRLRSLCGWIPATSIEEGVRQTLSAA